MHGGAVDQLVLFIEAPVLNDDRNLELTARQAQSGFLGVVDDDSAGQAIVDLRPR